MRIEREARAGAVGQSYCLHTSFLLIAGVENHFFKDCECLHTMFPPRRIETWVKILQWLAFRDVTGKSIWKERLP